MMYQEKNCIAPDMVSGRLARKLQPLLASIYSLSYFFELHHRWENLQAFFFLSEPLTLRRAHVAGLVWDWTLTHVKRPSWVSELSDVSANMASANPNLPAQHLQQIISKHLKLSARRKVGTSRNWCPKSNCKWVMIFYWNVKFHLPLSSFEAQSSVCCHLCFTYFNGI